MCGFVFYGFVIESKERNIDHTQFIVFGIFFGHFDDNTNCMYVVGVYGHFAYWTSRLLDTSPTDISPTNPKSDVSPTKPKSDISPTNPKSDVSPTNPNWALLAKDPNDHLGQ
ncbi:hypothetical protein niasHT_016494 [Heterodera trifolii]|uniref:Uncharacterized protein n=1 Tax=Heterodera trifolii TaxID=157864 RepID=A0ABD2LF20_9BILA